MDEIVVTHQPRKMLYDDGTEETSLVEPILSIAEEEDILVPKVFDRLSRVRLHHEWMTESYDSGSYRYLHYTAYGGDGIKVFDGQIETVYDSELKWCLHCWPSTVRIRLADTNGTDILVIALTGRLRAHPIDTAELRLPCGHLLATVKWNMPWFEVYDMDDERALMMKWPRCIICSLSGEYRILTGDGKTELGTMDASYTVLGPKWSGEEVLNTYVPEMLDPRMKAAWVSLMFLLKLGAGGREYAKIVAS